MAGDGRTKQPTWDGKAKQSTTSKNSKPPRDGMQDGSNDFQTQGQHRLLDTGGAGIC